MKFMLSLCLFVSCAFSARASETCPEEYYVGYQSVLLGFAMLELAERDKEYAEVIDTKEVTAEIKTTCLSLLPKYKDIDVTGCKLDPNDNSQDNAMPIGTLVKACGKLAAPF